jgi:catechol 2,3-dioxygenase-like lactoylglutathione lyase family enzyme
MFQSPHIRLLVDDFSACFRFYRDTLGFPTAFGSEDDVYADFETGGQGIALFARSLMAEAVGSESHGTDAQDASVLVLATQNVDEAAAALRAKGVALATEPTDRPLWGIRTAHFRDPDGHLIEINSPLAQ